MENKTIDNKDNIDDNTDKYYYDHCPKCNEKFNFDDNLPKKLTGCDHIICSNCVEKIYNLDKKNFLCCFCREKITKRPIDLKNDNSILKKLKTGKELECFYCQNKEDFINFFYDEDEKKIKCKKCSKKQNKKNKFRLVNIFKEYNNNIQIEIKNFNDFVDNIKTQLREELNDYLKKLKKEINDKLFNYIKNIIINNLKNCKNIDYEILEFKLSKIKENLEEIQKKFLNYENDKKSDIFKIFPYENSFKKIKTYEKEIEGINNEIENIKENINIKDKNLFPEIKDIKNDIKDIFKSKKLEPKEIVQKCNKCGDDFDDDKKIPKIFPFCKHIICIDCLLKQYNKEKNISCNCGAISGKKPKDLITYENYFIVNKFVECLQCRKRARREEFYFDDENNKLICNYCIRYIKNIEKKKNKNENEYKEKKYKHLKESIFDFKNKIDKSLKYINNIIKSFDEKIKNELIGHENNDNNNNIDINDNNNNEKIIKENLNDKNKNVINNNENKINFFDNFFDNLFDYKLIENIEDILYIKIKNLDLKKIKNIIEEINKNFYDISNLENLYNKNENKYEYNNEYEEKFTTFMNKYTDIDLKDEINEIKNKIDNYLSENLKENYLLINKNDIINMISELFRKNIAIKTKKNNNLSVFKQDFSIINLRTI